MKPLLLFCALCVCFGAAWGQEFKLTVSVNANNITRHLTFGFDSNASDSMYDGDPKDSLIDKRFGELLLPPGGAPGDFDCRMTDRTIGRTYLTFYDSTSFDGGLIDIRRKPRLDSAQLRYEMYTNAVDIGIPISFSWNNNTIPPMIKHIYLAPEGNPDIKVRLDMMKESQFSVAARFDSASLYSVMLITVIYNTNVSDVHEQQTASSAISIFPNPMENRSTLNFILDEDSRVNLSVYDITGKKVFERIINGYAGENEAGIGKNDFSAHSGIYLIRLSGVGNSFEKSTTLIVQ